MSHQPGGERRSHTRTPALGTATILWDETRAATYRVANLSAGGALVSGEARIAVGTRVQVVLNLGRDQTFRLEATIDRAHETPGQCDLALAFARVPATVEDGLQTCVLNALVQKRKERPKHVIVAGPAHADREALEREIRTLGLRTLTSDTPDGSMDLIARSATRVDVAFVDVSTEPSEWINVLTWLGWRRPLVRRVAVTSETSADALDRARPAIGNAATLRKPWSHDELVSAIDVG